MSRIYDKICTKCNNPYVAHEKKSLYCQECRKPKPCKCGCGKIINDVRKDYAVGCKIRGKTYKEIYGTKIPKCGYQKGANNVACRSEIRKIISEKVTKSYTPELRKQRSMQFRALIAKQGHFGKLKCVNSVGERFRSKLEVIFSELLIKHEIKYEYEYRLPLHDGTTKVVDFKIGNILVEISGYAYKAWRDDFNNKIEKMRKSCNDFILLLTYPKTVEMLKDVAPGLDACVTNIYDEKDILAKLAFFDMISKISELSKNFYAKENSQKV